MRGLLSCLSNLAFYLRQDLRQVAGQHFSSSIGGSASGVFFRLPLTGFSTLIEHGDIKAGYGYELAGAREYGLKAIV